MRIKNVTYLIYSLNRKETKKMEDLYLEKYKKKFHYLQNEQKPKFARYGASLNLDNFYHFYWGNVDWVYKTRYRTKLSVSEFLLLRDFYLYERKKIKLNEFRKYLYHIFKGIDKYIPEWYNFLLLKKNRSRIKSYFNKGIIAKQCLLDLLKFDGNVLDPTCNWYNESLKNKILKRR